MYLNRFGHMYPPVLTYWFFVLLIVFAIRNIVNLYTLMYIDISLGSNSYKFIWIC